MKDSEPMGHAAIFLDRDGTINVEKDFVHRSEDWEWLPESVEAIRGFNELGFKVIVVSNQSGIARGLYGHQEVQKLHRYVDEQLVLKGARIDAYYYCPHHPQFGMQQSCSCRKPQPGLLLQARELHDIDFGRSYLIGDKVSDIQAGVAAGVTPILVTTGRCSSSEANMRVKCLVVANLLEAYRWISSRCRHCGTRHNETYKQ